MNWTSQQPVDIIFTTVEELQDMADTAGQPITDAQMIKYSYIILHKAAPFREGIKLWNRRPSIQHTWTNLKLHFWRIQAELCKSGEPTVRDLQSANIIQEIIDGVNRGLQASPTSSLSSSIPPTPTTDNNNSLLHMANAMNTSSDIKLLQQQIALLSQQTACIQTSNQPSLSSTTSSQFSTPSNFSSLSPPSQQSYPGNCRSIK
mmetsp:Transcript_39431/g.92097  ORF Transcript_39431/g.92097 Transcript_39431/m.92097 type:complete len:204 (-) Transcript_39431:453-1064(-)